MKKKLLNFCSRTTLVCLEILAVIVGLGFLTLGVLIWRLTAGPVDVGFAKGYIEQALHDPTSGYDVALESVVVQWPDLRGPLNLDIGGIQLSKDGAEVLNIENVSLGLATRYLFVGGIEPISIVLTQPVLNLVRTENNEIEFVLTDNDPKPEPKESEEQDTLMTIIDILSRPEGQVDKRSPLGKLQTIEIIKAKMVMADYLLGITWFISPLDMTFARDEQGLVITANAVLPGGRDSAARIQTDLVFMREQKEFLANIHIQDFDPHILSSKIEELDWLNPHYAILNGNIELAFNSDLHVHKAALSLSSMSGSLKLDGVYDAPFPFEEISLYAMYDEEKKVANLQEFAIRSKGIAASVSSLVTIGEDSFTAPIKIEIPDLPQEKISPIWPDSLRGEGAEIWLTQKLSKGRIHDIVASVTVAAKKQDDTWDIDIQDIIGAFKVENMDIDYRAPLDPVKAANGSGHFENDTLDITIDNGTIRDMSVQKGTVALDKIMEGGGYAKINLGLNGPLQSVLRYIQPEPIGMSEEKLGLKVSDVKGTAALDINVSFPTIKDLLSEQVIVKAKGTLNNVLLPDIVKTLDLSGGPFTIEVADGTAKLGGQGKLEGRDIKFSWQEYIDPEGKDFASQVKAEMIADKGLRDALGIGLDDWIEGSFPSKVTYTEYGGGRAEANVQADLGPGKVMIGPLDYEKPIGTKGTATCKITFSNGYVQEVKNLSVETPRLRMDNTGFKFQTVKGEAVLKQGLIPEFFLDENALNINLEIGQNDTLKLLVKGAFLDARPFLDDKKKSEKYDGPAVIVSASVDRMRTHAARIVDKVQIYLDMNKQGDVDQFEMDAVAGKGDIYLRLKPNAQGVMALRLEADDAGAALRAFDMYENIEGGKLVLYGEAANKQQRKIIHGNAELTDFRVVKAPVLAQLLSAISLLGIQQILGGEGIYFSRLESEFDWHIDRKGDKYIVKEGRTSGSSLGLTFDGTINKEIDQIKMKGTIVPVSMVNEIVSSIPLIGDILTGGGGGIIAATYEVEGPIKKPQVSVNPLSALAPGILRTILFE